jgi:hypothetical protein
LVTEVTDKMSNELLAIIIAVCIFIPTVLFYHFVIVDNYLDKYLPPTIKSLFSNGNPRNLNKKKDGK